MRTNYFNWRKLFAIAISLAAVTIFSACSEEDPDAPLNSGADFLTFTFDGIKGKAIIDKDALTITATAGETTDLSYITPVFTLSDGAKATWNRSNGEPVVSGEFTCAFDINNTYTFAVTSSDGSLINIWNVTVSKETDNNTDSPMLFGVKQGTIIYDEYYSSSDNGGRITFIFDDYGRRIKMETQPYRMVNGIREEDDVSVFISDLMAGNRYEWSVAFNGTVYNESEEHWTPVPNEWPAVGYHIRSEAWWANRHTFLTSQENFKQEEKTFIEKECIFISWTEDGYPQEAAGWNNITFWLKTSSIHGDY
ncbi:MAG: hypothetical protein LBR81_04685, partial [Prevotellaceae bacterium]|nr:hypothetical protein [Prevotellaceae bacterium]